jgi:hypothetical protein
LDASERMDEMSEVTLSVVVGHGVLGGLRDGWSSGVNRSLNGKHATCAYIRPPSPSTPVKLGRQ